MKENISKAEESCLTNKNRKGLSAQIKQECAKKQSRPHAHREMKRSEVRKAIEFRGKGQNYINSKEKMAMGDQ